MSGLAVKIKRAEGGNGFDCHVRVGEFTIGAVGAEPTAALNAATGLASDLMAVIEQNPALAALLPPQATAALSTLRLAAAAARAGNLDKVPAAAANAVKSILNKIF